MKILLLQNYAFANKVFDKELTGIYNKLRGDKIGQKRSNYQEIYKQKAL